MASPPITSEDRGPSSDMSAFRQILARAKNIVVLSGAGISAESGVPTFRYQQLPVARASEVIVYKYYISIPGPRPGPPKKIPHWLCIRNLSCHKHACHRQDKSVSLSLIELFARRNA